MNFFVCELSFRGLAYLNAVQDLDLHLEFYSQAPKGQREMIYKSMPDSNDSRHENFSGKIFFYPVISDVIMEQSFCAGLACL